jgi:transcriptional regulator with XRE-family HTH domain
MAKTGAHNLSPFGRRVDRWRMDAGFRTLSEFARALGMPNSSVSRLMRQREVPKVATLTKLAETLGRDAQELHALALGLLPQEMPARRINVSEKSAQVTSEDADDRDTPGQGEQGIGGGKQMPETWLDEPYVREIARAAAKLPEHERGELLLNLLGRAIKGGIGTKVKNQ